MCFAWISEERAIISLYSNHLLVFITEAECLLQGAKSAFKSDRYSFVLKGLIKHMDDFTVYKLYKQSTDLTFRKTRITCG